MEDFSFYILCLCGNLSLLFAVCCHFHLLCDICLDDVAVLAKHEELLFLVSTCTSSPFFVALIDFVSFFVCVMYWCPML